jgi:hypothetical protein
MRIDVMTNVESQVLGAFVGGIDFDLNKMRLINSG